MLNDILAAIPWGILLAFTIGPVFFVLIETSITKGFKAAITFDFGVVFGDLVFILIAYFSTNQLLEKLKDDPSLFIFGGVIMFVFGLISFIREKRVKKTRKTRALSLMHIVLHAGVHDQNVGDADARHVRRHVGIDVLAQREAAIEVGFEEAHRCIRASVVSCLRAP